MWGEIEEFVKNVGKTFLFFRKFCKFASIKLCYYANDWAIHHKWTNNRHPLFAVSNRLCISL